MSTTRETGAGGEAADRRGLAAEAERLLAVSLDLLLIADFDYRIRRVNPAWLHVTGYSADELLGRSFLELIHPDDRERAKAEWDRVASTGGASIDFEHRGISKDGSIGWFLWSAKASAEEGLVYASAKDVTGRRRAEDALRTAEARFRGAFEHAPVGMAILEPDGTWSRVNGALAEFLGYSIEELEGKTFRDVTHPADLDRDLAALDDLAAGRTDRYNAERRYLSRDGTVVWGHLTVTAVDGADEEPRRVISQVLDITARMRAERFRAAQHAVAHVTVESTDTDDAARTMLSAVGEAMDWEAGAIWEAGDRGELRRIAAWSAREEAVAPAEREVDPAAGVAGADRARVRVLRTGEPAILPAGEGTPGPTGAEELLLAAIGGDETTFGVLEFRGQVVGRPNAELETHMSSLGAQVWQLFTRKRAEGELAHQAMHDSLIGLPNRALLLDRLEQALARAKRTSSTVAVLFIDVDNFKFINDTSGHDAGDQFLRLFADRVRRVLRPADSMARLGGDEFVLLLEDLHGDRDAERVADRVLLALERPFDLGEDEQLTSASIGIAVSNGGEGRADDLLRDADSAMYLVKARGRAGYEFYTDRMRDQAFARIETERALRRGLNRDELHLVYQPQVSLETGEVVAVEALVRWDHPERGLVRPDQFISVAEESGAIVSIGAWALREACRQAAAWRAQLGDDAPLPLFLNLSGRQLVWPDLMATVARAVTEAGIAFGDIGVEVTESALIDAAAVSMRNLRALRGAGVRVLLDDFGTGYSSLSHLNTLPLDGLKIDHSFIAGMAEDSRNEAIVKAVAAMGRAMGLRVVAEGVETAAQEARAREFGCTMVQGFRFSPPVSAEELPELLKRFGWT